MNELDDLSAGDLQPYNPGQPLQELQPLQPDNWGRTDILTNQEIYQRQPQGPALFGSPLPAGTSKQQVEQMLGELGAAFMSDFAQLGYPSNYVQAAISFMQANATKAPYQVTRQHNFNLHGQDDWLGNAFGNMVHQLSGSPRAKQQFITAALQWLAKVSKKLNSQQVPTAHGSAPNSAEGLLGQLSEADYNRVVEINNQAQAKTMNYLAAKYGQYSVKEVIRIANDYLVHLPEKEREHFDQFSTGWVHMMNTPETIDFLYNAAIGANNIPQDGAGLAREIAEFEAMLKIPSERAKYMRDSQMQARLRTLYNLRDGG